MHIYECQRCGRRVLIDKPWSSENVVITRGGNTKSFNICPNCTHDISWAEGDPMDERSSMNEPDGTDVLAWLKWIFGTTKKLFDFGSWALDFLARAIALETYVFFAALTFLLGGMSLAEFILLAREHDDVDDLVSMAWYASRRLQYASDTNKEREQLMATDVKRASGSMVQTTVNTADQDTLKVLSQVSADQIVYLKAIEIDVDESDFDNAGAAVNFCLYGGTVTSGTPAIDNAAYIIGSKGSIHYAAAGDISGPLLPLSKRYAPGEVTLSKDQSGDVNVTLMMTSSGQTADKFSIKYLIEVYIVDL